MSEVTIEQLREKIRVKRTELETRKSELYLLEIELERAIANSSWYKDYRAAADYSE